MDLLSLTGRQWKTRTGDDLRVPFTAARSSELLALLQTERGIEPYTKGEVPVRAGMDPSVFPDVGKAMERLESAVQKEESIGIFGDYDCDGITSTTLLARALHRRGIEPILRLPHRTREGYGLREPIVREMAAAGVTLLFTLDTGITARDEVALAVKLGMDVIILDHHRVPRELPPAFAILHPALAVPQPIASPAAAGVTWSFVCGLEAMRGAEEWDGWETDIALAALGTVADLVDLRGDNRSLVHRGLMALQSIQDGPFALLRLQSGLQDATLTSRDLAFRLAPRLNAAGRMADPSIALRALLGDHHALLQLDELNTQRQTLVKNLTEDILVQAAADTRPFIVMAGRAFLPGICGLLAGKLTETLGKPSLVGYLHENGMCTASLRSIPGYDVTAGLQKNADLLQHFGGHAMAAGCSFRTEHLPALRERFADDVEQTVKPDELVPSLFIDVCADAACLTLSLCEALHSLEPFGQANPEPVFLLRNVLLRDVRPVGRDQSHLQGMLKEKKVIGFHLGKFAGQATEPLDLVCRLGIDTWRGARNAQLFVEDIRVSAKVAGVRG